MSETTARVGANFCLRSLQRRPLSNQESDGPNRMVNESDLPQLNYLCKPSDASGWTVPHPPRIIARHVINGYYIPAKTRVFINTHGLGRNTKIWDNVEEFRPERHWVSEGSRVEISHGADFKILPFCAGKRKCPGAPLGMTLVLMALAWLFHCFDWTPPEGLRPQDIDTKEVYGMTMPKVHPLMAGATPRSPNHMYH